MKLTPTERDQALRILYSFEEADKALHHMAQAWENRDIAAIRRWRRCFKYVVRNWSECTWHDDGEGTCDDMSDGDRAGLAIEARAYGPLDLADISEQVAAWHDGRRSHLEDKWHREAYGACDDDDVPL